MCEKICLKRKKNSSELPQDTKAQKSGFAPHLISYNFYNISENIISIYEVQGLKIHLQCS